MKKRITKDADSKKTSSWLIVSGIAFLATILASAILVFYGNQLESIGIVGNLYYIILIPLGFSAAAFLSGAMKSYANFTTNESFAYGKLKLAGPVVIFALVVGGGFIMPNLNKEKYFDIKFRILSDDKSTGQFNDGKLILYIGKEPKTSNIHDGEAIFYNIPATYSNKSVEVLPVIEDYKLADSGNITISDKDDYINVNVVRIKESLITEVRGSVFNENNIPVRNAFVNFGSGLASGYTDQNGDFFFSVPLPEGDKISLKVLIDDVVKFNENITLSSTVPISVKL